MAIAGKRPPGTTLFIDGDILAFRSVSVHTHAIEWDHDLWSNYTDLGAAKITMRGLVQTLANHVQPDHTVLAITGPGETFRHRLWPTYKGGRKPKPPGYREFQDWLQEEFTVYLRPGLEADDSLGILMTTDELFPGRKVLWSGDKDLTQVPGTHLKDGGELVTITQAEGDRMHAYQTLVGDTTDNYPGLKGCGPVKADALIQKEGRTPAGLWAAIEAAYSKAGMTREDMLVQARVARILTAEWFDFDAKQPLMWEPPTT